MAKRHLDNLGSYLEGICEVFGLTIQNVRRAIDGSRDEFDEKVQSAIEHIEEEERTDFVNESADEDVLLSMASRFTNQALLVAVGLVELFLQNKRKTGRNGVAHFSEGAFRWLPRPN